MLPIILMTPPIFWLNAISTIRLLKNLVSLCYLSIITVKVSWLSRCRRLNCNTLHLWPNYFYCLLISKGINPHRVLLFILMAKNFQVANREYTCQCFGSPFKIQVPVCHQVYLHISTNIFPSTLKAFIYSPSPIFNFFIFLSRHFQHLK
jgi:hypothetical protein